jgi:hypothetical protein
MLPRYQIHYDLKFRAGNYMRAVVHSLRYKGAGFLTSAFNFLLLKQTGPIVLGIEEINTICETIARGWQVARTYETLLDHYCSCKRIQAEEGSRIADGNLATPGEGVITLDEGASESPS